MTGRQVLIRSLYRANFTGFAVALLGIMFLVGSLAATDAFLPDRLRGDVSNLVVTFGVSVGMLGLVISVIRVWFRVLCPWCKSNIYDIARREYNKAGIALCCPYCARNFDEQVEGKKVGDPEMYEFKI